ncbi:hypothetical protein K4F52_009605 [Lecanicillium sp. MT-2017a]|nr:hypothetical protein K4F52_009605 [Lecanicillium sp. MT-2017a]
MHFSIIMSLALQAAASAYVAGTVPGSSSLDGLMKRQFRVCDSVPVGPNLCERSCGPGYVSCVNETTCYNPSRGDVCCSNGKYCEAGSYCTNNGCCPNDSSLEECGATATVPTLAPPEPETPTSTNAPGTPSSEPEPPATDSVPGDAGSTTAPPVVTSTPSPAPNTTSVPPVVDGAGYAVTANALLVLGGLVAVFVALN